MRRGFPLFCRRSECAAVPPARISNLLLCIDDDGNDYYSYSEPTWRNNRIFSCRTMPAQTRRGATDDGRRECAEGVIAVDGRGVAERGG